ncbi:helix-turn-helix domain-containing protein [Trebonia sp.]|uniref:helix-turn-helix domain-containing protein n=1 Tax=Trebonia sp. TaxID=2767075 RepID=UPI00345B56BD
MRERNTSARRSMMPPVTLYDSLALGEPLLRPVPHPAVDTRGSIWLVGDWAVDVPPSPPRPIPEAARLIALVRDRTGWSARRLAELLGVSHSTVRRIAGGQQPKAAHSGNLPLRLRGVYDVVDRIYLLQHRDPSATAHILDEVIPGRRSAVSELRDGNPAAAYLAAIDALRPPRSPGLLTGDRPKSAGATAPLHE